MLLYDIEGTVVFTGVYKGPLVYGLSTDSASSDGLNLFVVLGQQVSELHLERRRQHLVVGGSLLGVENEGLGDLVTLPIGFNHVVLLEVGEHEGSDLSTGTEGCVVAGGVDTRTVQRST